MESNRIRNRIIDIYKAAFPNKVVPPHVNGEMLRELLEFANNRMTESAYWANETHAARRASERFRKRVVDLYCAAFPENKCVPFEPSALAVAEAIKAIYALHDERNNLAAKVSRLGADLAWASSSRDRLLEANKNLAYRLETAERILASKSKDLEICERKLETFKETHVTREDFDRVRAERDALRNSSCGLSALREESDLTRRARDYANAELRERFVESLFPRLRRSRPKP